MKTVNKKAKAQAEPETQTLPSSYVAALHVIETISGFIVEAETRQDGYILWNMERGPGHLVITLDVVPDTTKKGRRNGGKP